MSKSINILIIGSGPAGLSSAIALAKDGFSVTLIEAFSLNKLLSKLKMRQI